MGKTTTVNTLSRTLEGTSPGSKEAATAIQAYWDNQRAQAFEAFESARAPFAYLKQLSEIADETVAAIWQQCTQKETGPWALVATGGYGRRELYPYSDLDLLLLHSGDPKPLEPQLQGLLHALWNLKLARGPCLPHT
jgi:UTP:GlnB (protein PII) uridylyltransferase